MNPVAPMGRARRRLAPLVAAAALALLGGCESLGGKDGIFSGINLPWTTTEEPRLPGERISILLHATTLAPDPGLTGKPILLPPPSPTADWPQAGGYPNHVMQHLEVGDTLRPVWRVNAGTGAKDGTPLVAPPVVGGGRIYVMDADTQISAFDAASGRRLWRARLTPRSEDDGHIGGGMAYDNGRLFVTTGFAHVIALDAKTGRMVWRRTVGTPMRTPPTVRGGRVFVITTDNKLHALAATDGNPLWHHAGISEIASLLGGGSPAVDAGVIVAPFSSGEVVALKVDTGRVVWEESLVSVAQRREAATLSHVRARPAIDRGRVFALGNAGIMVAIDLRSGRRIWEKDIGGQQSPWIAGDYIFVLTNNSELIALSRANGAVHWVRSLPRFEDPEDREDPIVWRGPVLASDRLIITGSHGVALSVSPYTGQIIGRERLPERISVAPVIANRTVYFLTDDAELIAYR